MDHLSRPDGGRGPQTLGEQAYEHLVGRILSLELAPGLVLEEGKLAEHLGIGRTPIREALQRLRLERLVNVMSYRGIVITDLSFQDLREIVELRLVLEAECGRMAVQRVTPRQLEELRALAARHVTLRHQPDARNSLIDLDQAFHAVLLQATQNSFLANSLGHLQKLCLRFGRYLMERDELAEPLFNYEEIIEALERRDADAASKALTDHFHEFARCLTPSPGTSGLMRVVAGRPDRVE